MIDLVGRRFGRLVVLAETSPYIGPTGKKVRRWHCRCGCGKELDVLQNALTAAKGGTRSCGCSRRGHCIEMSGQRFGRLLVLGQAPLEKPQANGTRTGWLCRCDCGNQVILSRKDLLSGQFHSCGCLLKEASKARLPQATGQRDGTTISMIQPDRPANKNSKSGIKGVYWSTREHCWIAKIGVQGKTITLGRFHSAEDAAEARRAGEEKYFAPLINKK